MKNSYIWIIGTVVIIGLIWYASTSYTIVPVPQNSTVSSSTGSTATQSSTIQKTTTGTHTSTTGTGSSRTISATINGSSLVGNSTARVLTGTAQNVSSVYLAIWLMNPSQTPSRGQVVGVTVPVTKGKWSYESGFTPGTYLLQVFLNANMSSVLATANFNIQQY